MAETTLTHALDEGEIDAALRRWAMGEAQPSTLRRVSADDLVRAFKAGAKFGAGESALLHLRILRLESDLAQLRSEREMT